MSTLLTAAVVAAGINTVLLVGLLTVWVQSYRSVGAAHTLGLIVVGSFLFLENGLWLYFYGIDATFRGWYQAVAMMPQLGMFALCALETVALAVLAYVTWQ